MACSCSSKDKQAGQLAQNNQDLREESLKRFTNLQKLIAEKAIKMPAENNPAVLHKFNADPAVLVFDDTVYIYCTGDSQQAEYSLGNADNSYDKINTLNVFKSKDLVNWTDCGVIKVAGSSGAAKWARNSWAPAICSKKIDGKDKFFLYFADSANGIGVLSADSPLGPFVDPLGKALVSRGMPGIDGVHWLFDPAVLVDDDGSGYLYFGGGHQEEFIHPKSARCVKLGDDMISLASVPAQIDAPFLFEDSGINKIGDTYYYSYCSNWQSRDGVVADPMVPVAVIAYMTSKNPLGPFEYQGYTLENPGTMYGAWGNNHHWIFEFRGKYYIAYHAQIIEKTIGFSKGGYRNLMITDFTVNEDGSWPIQKGTKAGVAQSGTFSPYEIVPAATMCYSRNIIVSAKQTLYALKDGAYLCIKGVDFSKGPSINSGTTNSNSGTARVVVNVAEGHKGGSVEFRANHFANGELLACLEVAADTQTAEAIFTLPAEKISDLYIILNGDVELVSWRVE